MIWLNNLRYKIGHYFLKQELVDFSRERGFDGFENSKSIGILFDATQKDDLELATRYVKYLKDHKKRIKAIGFFQGKTIPDMVFSKLEFDYFTKKDLNWYFKPMPGFVDQFIDEEFDILIDLNLDLAFPLQYISELSKAKFKIGKFQEGNTHYDFMIDVPEDKGIKYFLRNLDLYIQQINTIKGNE